jgi:hypothetical protein
VDLKQEICRVFCSDIAVSEFDGGYAIGTPYSNRVGDNVGIYAIAKDTGVFRLVDNALTMSVLESEGVILESQTRRKAFSDLLTEYGAEYDEESGELFVDGVNLKLLARSILSFSALLLRVNDLVWLSQEKTKSTFKEDVRSRIRSVFAKMVAISITEDEPVSDDLKEVVPDMVITAPGREPVAVFIATEDVRVWQAMHLRLIADLGETPMFVAAMLQRDNLITTRVRQLADNRLDAIPRYEAEPDVAIRRITRHVLGSHTVQ